jgi:hypothetical protein
MEIIMKTKVFVTKEHIEKTIARLKQLKEILDGIRKEKNISFEGDTNTWHDNFAYESLTREEKMAETNYFKAAKDFDDYVLIERIPTTEPSAVELYCLVKVSEENTATLEKSEKTIGLVPWGAEDYKNLIYPYNAPIALPLMGAKIGEERIVTIPMGSFKMKVLEIRRMKGE